MIALVERTTGRLHALCATRTEVADPLPSGLDLVEMPDVDPRAARWDEAARAFVPRAVVIRDLWQEVQNDVDFGRLSSAMRAKILGWFETLRLNKGQRYRREEA